MPPKNAKAAAALAKKDSHQKEVDAKKRAKDEELEAEKWSAGAKGKGKKDSEEEKKEAARLKKAELAALLAAEEKELGNKKPLKKLDDGPARGADKVAAKRTAKVEQAGQERQIGGKSGDTVELAATNIDDALDLLDAPTKSAGSSSAKEVERHPEKRMKAAFAAYEETMLPQLKAENPGLRLSQLKEKIFKMWQKAPENPFNQQHTAHNTTKEQERELVQKLQKDTEERLRIN